MAWTNPIVPNQVDFTQWLRVIPGWATNVCPDSAPSIPIALGVAQEIVAWQLGVGCPPPGSGALSMYCMAVYNLACDRMVNYANDITGQTFFLDMRTNFGIYTLSVGVSTQISDGGTAVGIMNPEQMKLFTMQDLQTLKTPWGREYMGMAQKYGRTIWGLS